MVPPIWAYEVANVLAGAQQRGRITPARAASFSGESSAEASAAAEDRQSVADESAATVGEDRGRLIKHAWYYWLMLTEGHLTERLFGGGHFLGCRSRSGWKK